ANFSVDRVDRGGGGGIWARTGWSPTYGRCRWCVGLRTTIPPTGENGRSDVRTRSYGHLSAHRAPPARRHRPSGSRDDDETVRKIDRKSVVQGERGENGGGGSRKREERAAGRW